MNCSLKQPTNGGDQAYALGITHLTYILYFLTSTLFLTWVLHAMGIFITSHVTDNAARCALDWAPTLLTLRSRVDAARELRHIAHNPTLTYWTSPLNLACHPKMSIYYSINSFRQRLHYLTLQCYVGCGVTFANPFSYRTSMADSTKWVKWDCVETFLPCLVWLSRLSKRSPGSTVCLQNTGWTRLYSGKYLECILLVGKTYELFIVLESKITERPPLQLSTICVFCNVHLSRFLSLSLSLYYPPPLV